MQKCRYTFKESKNIGVTYLILSELSWAGMGRSQASAFRIVRGVVSVGSGLCALDIFYRQHLQLVRDSAIQSPFKQKYIRFFILAMVWMSLKGLVLSLL